jgi:hypothetical protein
MLSGLELRKLMGEVEDVQMEEPLTPVAVKQMNSEEFFKTVSKKVGEREGPLLEYRDKDQKISDMSSLIPPSALFKHEQMLAIPPDHRMWRGDENLMFLAFTRDQIEFCVKNGLKYSDVTEPQLKLTNTLPLPSQILKKLAYFAAVLRIQVQVGNNMFLTGTVLELMLTGGWTWLHPKSQVMFTAAYAEYWGEEAVKGILPKPTSQFIYQSRRIVEDSFIHFRATGPTPEDVITTVGAGAISGVVMESGGSMYIACQESAGIPCSVPPFVKWQYLRNEFKAKIPLTLSKQAVYEKHIDSYSVWSFELHARQIARCLSHLDPKTIVIAPGDGVGLIKRMWPGISISGDAAVGRLSHPDVKQENLLDTIRRGLSLKTESPKVIIMSYCQQFLTEEEIKWVATLKVPIYFVEASDQVTNRVEAETISPGFFGLHVGGKPRPNVPVIDRYEEPGSIYYTENLLNNEGFVIKSWTRALAYFYAMRPFAPIAFDPDFQGECLLRPRGQPRVAFASTIAELLHFRRREMPTYFYPVGQEIEDIGVVTSFMLPITLAYRQVYKAHKQQELDQMMVAKGIHVEEDHGFHYFYCVKNEVVNVPVYTRTVQSFFKAIVTFSHPSLLRGTPGLSIVYTPSKMYLFSGLEEVELPMPVSASKITSITWLSPQQKRQVQQYIKLQDPKNFAKTIRKDFPENAIPFGFIGHPSDMRSLEEWNRVVEVGFQPGEGESDTEDYLVW